MNYKEGQAAALLYNAKLPRLAANISACESKVRYKAHLDELQVVICKPCMLKVRPKPLRQTTIGYTTVGNVAKWRSKVFMRAMSTEEKASDWVEKRGLDREIRRLFLAKAHLRRQVTVENLRKYARYLSLSDVAARIKKITAAMYDARRIWEDLKPRDFTEFFADKSFQKMLVTLRKYMMPREMEKIYRQGIRIAKKSKASGPEGVPIEILRI